MSLEDHRSSTGVLGAVLFFVSGSIVLYELLLTRLFALVLFAHLANLAIALALLGIGIGAIALHMYPRLVTADNLLPRVGALALLQAAFLLLAVYMTLHLKLTEQWADHPEIPVARWNKLAAVLIHERMIIVLVPFLTLPFCAGGLAVAAIFKHARERIGSLYAADLVGGAIGSALFIPLLDVFAGPDVILASVLGCTIAAMVAFGGAGARKWVVIAGILTVGAVVANVRGGVGPELLKIRYTAGHPESELTRTRWTPLARLSVHVNEREDRHVIVLDNSSGSEIVHTDERLDELMKSPSHSIAFRLRRPPGRVAIIAASGGTEVAAAVRAGFDDVTAIDIAGGIFDIVREEYPHFPHNPYLQKTVHERHLDGRAAILQSGKFEIIAMRWANLNSAAGLLANAWSPSLLETREAFVDYLGHLTSNGVIVFAKGSHTSKMIPSALAALRRHKSRALMYASAIGYGYLAIETVLIHDLILVAGHPTYAVTLVVLVMLLGSGVGRLHAGRAPQDLLARRLPIALACVIILALVHALVLPWFYASFLLSAPLAFRIIVPALMLLPLAFFMGQPFPLALRILPKSGGEIVPWCWALNGWMSVVAAMATVFFSRQLGFRVAFFVAIAFYLVAWVVSRSLSQVGALSPEEVDQAASPTLLPLAEADRTLT